MKQHNSTGWIEHMKNENTVTVCVVLMYALPVSVCVCVCVCMCTFVCVSIQVYGDGWVLTVAIGLGPDSGYWAGS